MPELSEISLLKDYFDATSLKKEYKKDYLHTGGFQAPKEDFPKLLRMKNFPKVP